MSAWYSWLRPALFCLSPEGAHRATIHALRLGLVPAMPLTPDKRLRTHVFGLSFLHPIGIAPGFDKNAEAIAPLFRQHFSFVEVGTITPRAQTGNPAPRLFRLTEDAAVINRLGFNNQGAEAAVTRLRMLKARNGILGINIGKNRDSTDAVEDYLTMLTIMSPYADYITVNISSPNTPGLRDLQTKTALEQLISTLVHHRKKLPHQPPLLLKIAPDLTPEALEDIVAVATAHALDGIIISNTTVARPSHLKSQNASETGGLSGVPLFAPSTELLRQCYRLAGRTIPLIGVGGVASAADAYAKIRAGASLVQLYTSLVYQGFGLVRKIVNELPELLERDGFATITDAIGVDVQ